MFNYFKLAALIAACGLVFAHPAGANPPFQEYFEYENPTGAPVQIRFKPYGQGSANIDWQKSIVDPTTLVSIPLVGTQPFDIVIEHSDNTYEFLNHVKPCDWMDMCRKTGKIEYTPQIQFGDIALTKDGQKKYTPRSVQKVTVRANGNSVELPIFSHGKRLAPSPQAPAPPPPPYAQ